MVEPSLAVTLCDSVGHRRTCNAVRRSGSVQRVGWHVCACTTGLIAELSIKNAARKTRHASRDMYRHRRVWVSGPKSASKPPGHTIASGLVYSQRTQRDKAPQPARQAQG